MAYKDAEFAALKQAWGAAGVTLAQLEGLTGRSESLSSGISVYRFAHENARQLIELIEHITRNIQEPLSPEDKADLDRLHDRGQSLLKHMEKIAAIASNQDTESQKSKALGELITYFNSHGKAIHAMRQVRAQLEAYLGKGSAALATHPASRAITYLRVLERYIQSGGPYPVDTTVTDAGLTLDKNPLLLTEKAIKAWQSAIQVPALQNDAKGTSLMSTFHRANRDFDTVLAQETAMTGTKNMDIFLPAQYKALQMMLQLRLKFEEYQEKLGYSNTSASLTLFGGQSAQRRHTVSVALFNIKTFERKMFAGEILNFSGEITKFIEIIQSDVNSIADRDLISSINQIIKLFRASKLDEENILKALTNKFPDNPGAVSTYMEYIHNIRTESDAKIGRVALNVSHSVVKIQGQHYLFNRTLGKGYCGTAVLAIHLEEDAPIVVKVTKPVENIYGSIVNAIAENERRILAHLQKQPRVWERYVGFQSFTGFSILHPANALRVVTSQKKTYMTQPLATGTPCDRFAANPLTIDSTKKFILSILRAMQILHEQQVFHGDIKLENIIFNPNDNTAIFIDFGLSQLTNETTGLVENNMLWMPTDFITPRQVVGFFHQKSPDWQAHQTCGLDTDVYALGLTLSNFLKEMKCSDKEDQADVNFFKKALTAEIIGPMMHANRGQRPSIGQLSAQMERLMVSSPRGSDLDVM